MGNQLDGKRVATPAGLEPATIGLEDRCSIQLSYGAHVADGMFLHRKTRCVKAKPPLRRRNSAGQCVQVCRRFGLKFSP